MTKKKVAVRQVVEVSVDEAKFDEAFMSAFRATMYPFQTIDDHIEHLGQLFARGIAVNEHSFIEGYGIADAMGIRFRDMRDGETEIVVKPA